MDTNLKELYICIAHRANMPQHFTEN